MKKIFFLLLCCLSCVFADDVQAVLASSSYLQYTASANNDPEHTWQGRAPLTTLHLRFDDDDVASRFFLEIVVRSGSFDSGNFIRDANARAGVFVSRQYPEIIFLSEETTLARLEEGQQGATVTGELSMHGITQEITVPVLLERNANTLTVMGSFDILLSDFGMKRPSSFGNTVDDAVSIAIYIVSSLE